MAKIGMCSRARAPPLVNLGLGSIGHDTFVLKESLSLKIYAMLVARPVIPSFGVILEQSLVAKRGKVGWLCLDGKARPRFMAGPK